MAIKIEDDAMHEIVLKDIAIVYTGFSRLKAQAKYNKYIGMYHVSWFINGVLYEETEV